ncbi:hypothetical protein AGMMS50284_4780 [Clostridia bacterium]|nr:hypothetical protein AGMMS50284_4780 [Clostridia bacterium]
MNNFSYEELAIIKLCKPCTRTELIREFEGDINSNTSTDTLMIETLTSMLPRLLMLTDEEFEALSFDEIPQFFFDELPED